MFPFCVPRRSYSSGSNNPRNWGNPRPAEEFQMFTIKLVRVLLSGFSITDCKWKKVDILKSWPGRRYRSRKPTLLPFSESLFLRHENSEPSPSWTWVVSLTCTGSFLPSRLKFPSQYFLLLPLIQDEIASMQFSKRKITRVGQARVEETFYPLEFFILDNEHHSHNSEPSV